MLTCIKLFLLQYWGNQLYFLHTHTLHFSSQTKFRTLYFIKTHATWIQEWNMFFCWWVLEASLKSKWTQVFHFYYYYNIHPIERHLIKMSTTIAYGTKWVFIIIFDVRWIYYMLCESGWGLGRGSAFSIHHCCCESYSPPSPDPSSYQPPSASRSACPLLCSTPVLPPSYSCMVLPAPVGIHGPAYPLEATAASPPEDPWHLSVGAYNYSLLTHYAFLLIKDPILSNLLAPV